jgi:CheY-like chemotaxis protein
MLVVEDNPADVAFLNEAIEAVQTPLVLHVVTNGEDALRFLRRDKPFADAPRPDVMVMDLNLPIKNGKEVLAEMMSQPALRTMPVAILTTSSSEWRMCSTYTDGRCRYFVKTDEFGQLQNIVREIVSYAEAALHSA